VAGERVQLHSDQQTLEADGWVPTGISGPVGLEGVDDAGAVDDPRGQLQVVAGGEPAARYVKGSAGGHGRPRSILVASA
jgi:hypothetical protein